MDDQHSSEQHPERLRETIIRRALDAFVHGGYSRTSTDTISRMMGISKKTLYKVFPSKEDILRSVVRMATRSIEERTEAIYSDHEASVADRLERLVIQISPIYARIRSPRLLHDFQRAAPAVWEELRAWRIERYIAFRSLIDEGITRGEIRNDISVDDIIAMYGVLVDKCMDYVTLETSSVSSLQLYQGLMELLLRGILTSATPHQQFAIRTAPVDRSLTLAASLALFNTFGYTKTSSDEIARSLGISKRTLYEQYAKKAHIATTILLQTAREVDRRCDPLTFDNATAFQRDLHTLITTYVHVLGELSPIFLDDLANALPRQHHAFMAWRRSSFEYHISRAAAEGRRMGLLRETIDAPALIALVRLTVEHVLLQDSSAHLVGSTRAPHEVVFTILYDGILLQTAQSPQQPTH